VLLPRRPGASTHWRNFSDNLELLRMSGGAPTLVMALQNPHSGDVVAQALTIICAAVSETGARLSLFSPITVETSALFWFAGGWEYSPAASKLVSASILLRTCYAWCDQRLYQVSSSSHLMDGASACQTSEPITAGSGKLTSKKGVLNFVTALLQANVLFAMSVIVTNVERTRLWIPAGEVSRAPTQPRNAHLPS